MTPVELLDHFAGLAMQVFITYPDSWDDMCKALGEDQTDNPGGKVLMEYIAHRSYQQARAMMREREKS